MPRVAHQTFLSGASRWNNAIAVDGEPPGRSLSALPPSSGVQVAGNLKYDIRAVQPEDHEVFFQAWLGGDTPRGYSNRVTAWFRTP